MCELIMVQRLSKGFFFSERERFGTDQSFGWIIPLMQMSAGSQPSVCVHACMCLGPSVGYSCILFLLKHAAAIWMEAVSSELLRWPPQRLHGCPSKPSTLAFCSSPSSSVTFQVFNTAHVCSSML